MVKSYFIRWTEPASHVQHAAAAAPPPCHCLPKSPSNCLLQAERGQQDPCQGFPQRGECKGQEWQEATQSGCVAGWQVPFLNLEGQHIVSRSPKSCKQSEFTKLKLNPVKERQHQYLHHVTPLDLHLPKNIDHMQQHNMRLVSVRLSDGSGDYSPDRIWFEIIIWCKSSLKSQRKMKKAEQS